MKIIYPNEYKFFTWIIFLYTIILLLYIVGVVYHSVISGCYSPAESANPSLVICMEPTFGGVISGIYSGKVVAAGNLYLTLFHFILLDAVLWFWFIFRMGESRHSRGGGSREV